MLISNAPDASTWLPDTRVFTDARTERGSLVGLHTALVHAPNGALVVAWDMPFVTHELLSMLRDAGTAGPATTIAAALPDGPRGAEPFCAFYTARCLPVIEAALDARDLRLTAFIDRLAAVARVSRVDVSACGDPERLFFNVNSAADLAVAESMASRDASRP